LECAPLLQHLDLEVARGDQALQLLFVVPIRVFCWHRQVAQEEVEGMRRSPSAGVLARGPTFAGCYYLLLLALT
jgi:hypothetical protein